MMRRLGLGLRRNAVACVALFIALSAGAYAVTLAPKNSVTSRSIRNGQVKSDDLSSTAAAGKLIKVRPNKATTASNDPCHRRKTGVFCGNSSQGRVRNLGNGFAPVSYSKDNGGIVHLSGAAAVPSPGNNRYLFILPRSMRPSKVHAWGVPCGQILTATCVVKVNPDGRVKRYNPTSRLVLDSISFRAGS